MEEPCYFEEIKLSFFHSIKNSNINDIILYFRNPNIKPWNFKEEEEYTALHRAAFMDKTLIASVMIDEIKKRLGIEANDVLKIWINCQSEQGYTALHYAAYRGNIELINILISNGAQIDIMNKRGLNVMHMSSQGNQPTSLVYFKEKYNLDIHSIDDMGSTPLHWACYTGSENSVLFLLTWSNQVNVQDREGLTPLHLAVMSERTRIIKRLLHKGASKIIRDSKGRTPYDLAVDKNKLSLIEILKFKDNFILCNFKAPLGKIEKSRFNIVFFFIIHLIIELSVFFILLPFINSKILSYLYIIMFMTIILIYTFLIYSNPGIISKQDSISLITLIEQGIKINEYCPICKIKKCKNSKHCILCDVCVEGFDHHCYWINNCIGKKNLNLFLLFIILVNINIAVTITISLLSFFKSKIEEENAVFPPLLLWIEMYSNTLKIILSILVLFIGIIFFFPVSALLILQLRSQFSKIKKKVKNYNSNDDKTDILLESNKCSISGVITEDESIDHRKKN